MVTGGSLRDSENIIIIIMSRDVITLSPPLSLHLQTRFDLQELNLNLKWMLEITTGKHLIATKLNMHK